MPFLPDEQSTDKLLKHLGIDLFQQFEVGQLKQFGWFEYRDHDHVKTLAATELAADAFLYLSFDSAGNWRRNPKVLTALIAFMARYFKVGPQVADLMKLKGIIEAKPLNREAVAGWFHSIYSPDVAA